MSTTIELEELEPLNEREIAIARGEDPDAIAPPDPEPTDTDPVDDGSVDSKSVDDSGRLAGEVTDDIDRTVGAIDAGDPAGDANPDPGAKPGEGGEKTWITDDVRELATAYSLSDDDLAGMSSLDEFDKVRGYLDRQIAATQTPAADPGPASDPDPKAGAPPSGGDPATPGTPGPGTQGTPPADSEPLPDLIDPEVYAQANFDEASVQLAKALRAEQERTRRLDEQLQQIAPAIQDFRATALEQQKRQAATIFHEALDGVDESIFGKAFDKDGNVVRLGTEHDDNRRKAWDAYEQLVTHMQGKAVNHRALVQRAANIALGDKIAAAKSAQRVAAAKAQAKTRRPVGNNSGKPAPEPNRDKHDAASIANDPKIVAAWDKMQEENGSV